MNKLKSRWARNIYFWVFMLYSRVLFPPDTLPIPLSAYYGLIFLNISVFAALVYCNNLILIPKLLAKKKYFIYLVLALLIAFIAAYIYTFIIKYEHIRFPQIKIFSVSIVSPPLTNTLSWQAVYYEMGTVHSVMRAFIIGFTGIWYVNAYTVKERLMQEIIKKQTETELNFLKTQINPHFLFNTLNNLYGLTLRKSDLAPEAILKLSVILRYVLYESNVPFISFEKEKEMMQAYIDIEMLRLHENNNVNFTIMSDSDATIPPLLWLPVLENVFKHGTNIISDETYVDFRFTIYNKVLSIYSQNIYKAGKQQNNLEKYGGIGLSNLEKRLELLYPERHTILAEHDENYFTLSIQITL